MIVNTVALYLESLTATDVAGSPICKAFGDSFTFGTNLFIGLEPVSTVDTLTIIPYGGLRPDRDKKRQAAAIQLRFKTSSRYKSLSVQQACIDTLDSNYLNGGGFMRANSSAPMIIMSEDNDRKIVSVSNYIVKYIK